MNTKHFTLPNGEKTNLPDPGFDLRWRDKGIVTTRQGDRHLFTAGIKDGWWEFWRDHKDGLKAAGISCGKDRTTDLWSVTCWLMPGASESQQRFEKSKIAMSRADKPSDTFSPSFPAGVTPYGYQAAGIEYVLKAGDRCIIGDDMGLGKTLQAIGVCNEIKPESVLVICPASLRLNWMSEWKRFSLQSKSQTLQAVLSSADLDLIEQSDVVFISYNIAASKKAQLLLRSRKWGVIICDEAHYLSNHKTGRSTGTLGLPPRVRCKDEDTPRDPIPAGRYLFLTGTPVSNRPMDFWNLLRFCDPAHFGNRTKFAQRYCGERRSPFGNGWDESGASNLEELQAIIRGTCMVRRLKDKVLSQLPSKTRKIVPLIAPSEVIQELDALTMEFRTSEETKAKAKAKVDEARIAGNADELQQAVDQLKQAKAAAFSEASKVRKEIGIAKVDIAILHIVDVLTQSGGKVIVGAHHTEVIKRLTSGLAKFSPVVVTGSTDPTLRQEAVNKFQGDNRHRVFIGNILAAGTGLTLTAAPHVIIVEPDWVPANNAQFEDRAHRIGQDKPVLIEYLAIEGTIDIQILKANARKMDTIERLTDKESELEQKPSEIQFGPKGPVTPIPSVSEQRDFERKQTTRKMELIKLGQSLSPRELMAAHRCVKDVALMDGDRASTRNDVGFSKLDSSFGASLARTRLQDLTDAQKGSVVSLAWKYRRQCADTLVAQLRNPKTK